MTSQSKFRTYLFEYEHEGARWAVDIPATSLADAKARLAKIADARYDGVLMASVPVYGKMRLFFRFLRRGFGRD